MEENYKTKRVLTGLVRNRDVGRFLGLEKSKKAVLDVMTQQKITVDPSKLAGYKRKEFLKAITKKIGIGYDAKKAFNSVYGDKKPEISARKTSIESTNKKNFSQRKVDIERVETMQRADNKVPNFLMSNKNLRVAENLINAKAINNFDNKFHPSRTVDEKEDSIKEILKRIQS
jgi:hypothetical protein